MANEIRVQVSLQISQGNNSYQSKPTSFQANMAGIIGPTPGAITVSKVGTIVNLSQIVVPGGVCLIQNLDPVAYLEYGVYVPGLTDFLPLGEILAGEIYLLRLSRWLGQELGTGSGTHEVGSGLTLQLKAIDVESLVAIVSAFDA
jgi:hypothetical protein